MEQISRRHHFNPKFLLKGFTPSGKRNDLVWEFDGDRFTKNRGTTKSVAWETDFYAIEREGERPDAVETMMGEIESTAAPIVSAIIEEHEMPRGRDFAHFLIFLALMYMRGPAWRDTLTSFHDQVSAQQFRLAASSEERWALVSKSKQWADRPERHLSNEEARQLRD